jgi:hypothetical protein
MHAFLRREILFVAFPQMSMASTYSKRIMKSPSVYLFIKTQWSGCALWYTSLVKNESNIFVPPPRSFFQAIQALLQSTNLVLLTYNHESFWMLHVYLLIYVTM